MKGCEKDVKKYKRDDEKRGCRPAMIILLAYCPISWIMAALSWGYGLSVGGVLGAICGWLSSPISLIVPLPSCLCGCCAGACVGAFLESIQCFCLNGLSRLYIFFR